PNLCSREWVYRQYDQFVGGNSVLRPGADAAVVRVEGTRRALALTVDCNHRYGLLDPYLGAGLAVREAARDLVAPAAPPVVSGTVSFYNETDAHNIPPTPTIAMVGLLDDLDTMVTPWWKAEGD